MDQRKLQELLDDMSLEEKISQMLQLPSDAYAEGNAATGPVQGMGFTRENVEQAGSTLSLIGAEKLKRIQDEYLKTQPHRIPLLFMADIINGYRTVFPIPLAQGCTFEPETAKRAAQIAARESAAAGLHVTFSPMVDLVRDARWGRVMESTGEDAYLNGLFGKAMVEGYQGENIGEKGRIAACVKHFAAYGSPTAGREYNNVELSERTLREDYLPGYQKAIEAGSELVMTSFNTLNRIPSTGNKWLMREILRGEMGFDGVLISDWGAVHELVCHSIAEDDGEAAQLAIEAGVDIEMCTAAYGKHLKRLVEEKRVPVKLIDEAVLRILELKNKLGLFENPYKDADPEEERRLLLCREHRSAARETAAKSFVLLQNREGLLPLQKQGKRLAFIGPYADNRHTNGMWSFFADTDDNVTIREAVCERGYADAVFETGCPVVALGMYLYGLGGGEAGSCDMAEEEIQEAFDAAVRAAKEADTVILCIGEHPNQSGEASSRAEITVPEYQLRLLEAVSGVNPNVVTVLFSGRPLDLRRVCSLSKAVLAVWFPGTETGHAVADVLFGDREPGGRLSMSFPYCTGQVPVFYNEFPTGRPFDRSAADQKCFSRYIDIPNEPLFPFGYGLTYTEFSYGKLRLSAGTLEKDGELLAEVEVRNTGERPGSEVVQLYIRDMAGSVVRPVRELKGFKRVYLEPGEQKTVTFSIRPEMLRFWTIDMQFSAEPGTFWAFAGGDSTAQNGAEFTYAPA